METMHDQSDLEQLVVFAIAEYRFALPIQDVFQVVNCQPAFNAELKHMGLVQLGHHVLQVLDLHQRLNCKPPLEIAATPSFCLIVHGLQANLYGIPVYEAPDLIEISSDMRRSLPRSADQLAALNMASQLIMLPWQGTAQTILLLDMQRVLNHQVATAFPALLQVMAGE